MINLSNLLIGIVTFLAFQSMGLSAYADERSTKKGQDNVIPSQRSIEEMAINSDQERMAMKTQLYNEIIGHLPIPSPQGILQHQKTHSEKTQVPADSK